MNHWLTYEGSNGQTYSQFVCHRCNSRIIVPTYWFTGSTQFNAFGGKRRLIGSKCLGIMSDDEIKLKLVLS